MSFCGNCGNQIPDGNRFCSGCGTPVAAAEPVAPAAPTAPAGSAVPAAPQPPAESAVPAAPAGPPTTPPLGEPAPSPRRGKGRIVLAGVAVLAVIGAGVAATTLLGGGGSAEAMGYAGTSEPLYPSVTSEPEAVWDWSPRGDEYPSAAISAKGHTLVGWGENVTAIDGDGEELWTEKVGYGYLTAVPGHDDIALLQQEESGTIAISTEDGKELWTYDDGWVGGTTEAGLLAGNDREITLLDAESGREIWSVRGNAVSVAGDAAYVLDGDEVSKLDLSSGDEQWTADVPNPGEESYPVIAASSELVVVATEEDVTGLSTGKGEELWSERSEGSPSTASAFGERVWVDTSDYDTEVPTSQVTFYDKEGSTDEIKVDSEEYFSGTTVRSGGKEYLVDSGTGTVYDQDLKQIDTFRGTAEPSAEGYYTLDGEDLSFQSYDPGEKGWSIRLPGDESAWYSVGDGAIFGFDGPEVTRYE